MPPHRGITGDAQLTPRSRGFGRWQVVRRLVVVILRWQVAELRLFRVRCVSIAHGVTVRRAAEGGLTGAEPTGDGASPPRRSSPGHEPRECGLTWAGAETTADGVYRIAVTAPPAAAPTRRAAGGVADVRQRGRGLVTPARKKRRHTCVTPLRDVASEGFEPPKATPADLQSDPFGRLGNSPWRAQPRWFERPNALDKDTGR